MKLRSKNPDKRLEDELEKEDSMVWKMQKSDQGYSFGSGRNPAQQVPQPMMQTSITLRKNPTDQYSHHADVRRNPITPHNPITEYHSMQKESVPTRMTSNADDRNLMDGRGQQSTPIYPYTNIQPQTGSSTAQGRQFYANSASLESKINMFNSVNNPVIVPTCSSWFDMSGIHQIERDSLPEFFTGKASKTPNTYKDFRNRIIMLCREDPKTYLTATMCRRNLVV